MDNGHARSAWPPHSYENIYFLQEHYESVVMSSQMVDQICSIPTLIHKGYFAYECLLRLSQGSQTGIVGGLTGRLSMPGRRSDAGDRGMGGPTVCGAQTGQSGVEPDRLSAGAAAPSSIDSDAPRGSHSPIPHTQ